VTDQLPPLNYERAAQAEAATRASATWSVRHLWTCWIALVAAAAVLSGAGALMVGSSAALGAALGAAIVGTFFSISALFLAWVGRNVPEGLMWAALGAYVLKVVSLGIVLLTFPVDGPIDRRWMAASIAIGVICWLGAHLRQVWTTRLFYVDPK